MISFDTIAKIKKGFLLILIVGILVVGYSIFFQKENQSDISQLPPPSSQEENIESDVNKEEINDDQPFAIAGEEIKKLLIPPATTASLKEKEQYYKDVERFSEESFQISINVLCKTGPVILKVNEGGSFSFINNDTEEHLIEFSGDTFTILPGGAKEVNAEIESYSGIYTYGCDGAVAGLILVLPSLE